MEEVAGKEQIMNVFEYEYKMKDQNGNEKNIRFQWVTSLELTKRNLEEMIIAGSGR